MQYFKRIIDLHKYLSEARANGLTIGFAPTMGALHAGHMSLIHDSKQQNDRTICSIFVNPTQFNDPADLEKYPRTVAEDLDLLYDHACDVVFLPGVAEIYPQEGFHTPELDFEGLTDVMEGAFRPGHFAGVAKVVYRLLNIIRPDRLYMGQKDYQQWTIIHSMLDQLQLPIELVMCTTVREPDGLAMSSRNRRLTPEFREQAPILFESLSACLEAILEGSKDYRHLEKIAKEAILTAGLEPEYFQIADGYTLQVAHPAGLSKRLVICVAAWAGEVRLIDNLYLDL